MSSALIGIQQRVSCRCAGKQGWLENEVSSNPNDTPRPAGA